MAGIIEFFSIKDQLKIQSYIVQVKQEAYQVETCTNGKEALKIIPEFKPDLVLSDIMMPEMDGISAVKEIKKVDPNAKIVMCSAMGQQAMVIEAIQAGARDFIVKPFQADRVLEAVRKAVG